MERKAGLEPVLYVPVVLGNLVESHLKCRNRIGSRRLDEVAFRFEQNGIRLANQLFIRCQPGLLTQLLAKDIIVQARCGPILVTFDRYCETIHSFVQNGVVVEGRFLVLRCPMIFKVQEINIVAVSEPLPAIRYGPTVLELSSADAVVRDIEGDDKAATPPFLSRRC